MTDNYATKCKEAFLELAAANFAVADQLATQPGNYGGSMHYRAEGHKALQAAESYALVENIKV